MLSESPAAGKPPLCRMVLFVAGNETNSRLARGNLQKICEEHLGVCELQVVDVLHDYRKALEKRVLITPTLLVESPGPMLRIVGTLEDAAPILSAMHLAAAGGQ